MAKQDDKQQAVRNRANNNLSSLIRKFAARNPATYQAARGTYNLVKDVPGEFAGAITEGPRVFGRSIGQAIIKPIENRRIARDTETDRLMSDMLARQAQRSISRPIQNQLYAKAGQYAQRSANIQKNQADIQRQAQKDALSGGFRTALTILPTGNLTRTVPSFGMAGIGLRTAASNILPQMAIGGTINAVLAATQRQNPISAFSRGAGESVKFAGLNKITSPLFNPAINTFGKYSLPSRVFGRALVGGGSNLLEDEVYTRLAEGRAPTARERLFSLGSGAIGGQFGNQKTEATKPKPEPKKPKLSKSEQARLQLRTSDRTKFAKANQTTQGINNFVPGKLPENVEDIDPADAIKIVYGDTRPSSEEVVRFFANTNQVDFTKLPRSLQRKIYDYRLDNNIKPPRASNRLDFIDKKNPEAFGLLAGIEPERDEKGNITGIKYNPEKGFIATAGLLGGKHAVNFANSRQFSSTIDKMTRFEIDDSGAKLKWNLPEINNKTVKLSDILDHKQLYQEYPGIKDLDVKIKVNPYGSNLQASQRGTFDGKSITLTGVDSVKDAKSTLLHEIQHAIQEIEGFARGGSPDMGRGYFLDKVMEKVDVKRSNMVAFQNQNVDELRKYDNAVFDYEHSPEVLAGLKRVDEINSILKKLPRGDKNATALRNEQGEILDKIIKNSPPKNEAVRQLDKLRSEMNNALQQLEVIRKDGFGYEGYKRLTGELEARAVQRRMDMPSEATTSFNDVDSFLEANKLYHGGNNKFIDQLEKTRSFKPDATREAGTGGNRYGLSITNKYDLAKDFSTSATGEGRVTELYVDPDARVFTLRNKTLDDLSVEETKRIAKEYDVIKDVDNFGGEGETRILNPDVLRDESYMRSYYDLVQMGLKKPKSIYQPTRANTDPFAAEAIATTGRARPDDFINRFESGRSASVDPKLKTLHEEAKNYKTAEEFIEAKLNPPKYAMSHRPSKTGGTLADITNKGTVIPKDFYSHPEWYANMRDPVYQESFDAIKKFKGKPDAEVTIYRASSKNELNPGDWVTLSKKYAQGEARDTTKVYAHKVKAKDIQFAGDDINEFGYFPTDYEKQLTEIWNKANKSDVMMSIDAPKGSVQELQKQLAEEYQNNKLAAEAAREVRDSLDPNLIKNINQIKRLLTKNKYASGDVETFRASKHKDLINKTIERVQELRPELDEASAFEFIQNAPTKADTIARRPAGLKSIKEVETDLWSQDFGRKLKESEYRKLESEWVKSYIGEAPTTLKTKVKQQKRSVTENEQALVKLESEWLKQRNEGMIKPYKKGDLGLEQPFSIFKDIKKAKDKGAFSYARETAVRNIEDTFGKNATKVKAFLTDKITDNETASAIFVDKTATRLRNTVKKYGISKNSKDDKLVFEFAEGRLTEDQLKSQTKNWKGVIETANEFRNTYDELLEKINSSLSKYGYDPIPKRANYMTHFQEVGNFFETFGAIFQDKTMRDNLGDKLPTGMSGINMDTRPGKSFFTSALPRTGDKFTPSAIGAMERYLLPASRQIYHTDSVQRVRALQSMIEQFAGESGRDLSNFNSWLSEYGNLLAGKKSVIDRPVEKVFGRGLLKAGNWLRRRTGANMVGGNVSSALTNFIPLTQSIATTSKPSLMRGLLSSMSTDKKKIDGVQSDFLTRRFQDASIDKNWIEKGGDLASWLFQAVDHFTSRTIVGGKYYEGLSKGMDSKTAMKQADEYAARLMADRSFGSTPTLFNSQVLGALTQFQLEVNNQLSFIFKDIPKNLGYTKAQAASSLGQIVIYSYLFNSLYESLTGRRPAFDPMGLAIQTYEDYTDEDIKKGQATKNLVNNVSNNLPFASVFTGGRLPVGAALPNPIALAQGETTLKKELIKPATYLLPPFGGGQIKKTTEGLLALNQGASVTDSGRVRYPITQTPVNTARTALFGQYSTPEARDYFRKGTTPLGENQSKIYTQLANDQGNEFYNQIMGNRAKERQITKAKEGMQSNSGVVQDVALVREPDGSVKSINLNKPKSIDDINRLQSEGIYTREQAAKEATRLYKEKLKITSVKNLPNETRYQQAKKEKAITETIIKIYNADISENAKDDLAKSLGVSPVQARYYKMSEESVAERIAFLYDQFEGFAQQNDRTSMLQMLIAGRTRVYGGQFVSDGVIDQIKKDGLITDAEARELKGLSVVNGKTVRKLTTKSNKPKKIQLKLSTKSKVKLKPITVKSTL